MSVTDTYLANNAAYAKTFSGPLPLPPSKHVAVLVTNLNLDTWEHLSHRAKTNFGDRIAGKRRVVIFRAKQCNGRRGFREAIGVHETSSDEQLERLFKNRKWHTSATIRKRCQHWSVGRRTVEVLHNSRKHRGNNHGLCNSFIAQSVEPHLRIE